MSTSMTENIDKCTYRSDQWLGFGEGDNDFGTVIVELDVIDNKLVGTFYAIDRDSELPSVWGFLELQKGLQKQTAEVELKAFDPIEGCAVDRQHIQNVWPRTELSETATLNFDFRGDILKIDWVSSKGLSGKVSAHSSHHPKLNNQRRNIQKIGWKDFKKLVSTDPYEDIVYRGQSRDWPLRSTFHRTNRSDLLRYFSETVPSLHRELSEQFPLGLSVQTKVLHDSLLFTAQHHGFPTPTLDWTRSPYVAAYFALLDASDAFGPCIFRFELRKWNSKGMKVNGHLFQPPYIRFSDPFPSANLRQRPQHGLVMTTNIANIESIVGFWEKEDKADYLTIYQLDTRDRDEALSDLQRMNVTPSTLFPGLDGICQSARHRHFGFD